MPSRDVDRLDPLPDEKLKQTDADYLTRHHLEELFSGMLQRMIEDKPMDPVQYVIDSLVYNPEYARQDPETGLPEHRKSKLLDVFRVMDQDGLGKVSFKNLQDFASKYGGKTLGNDELRSMFTDFNPSAAAQSLISQTEFLVFFAKVSKTISNTAFEQLVKELMA